MNALGTLLGAIGAWMLLHRRIASWVDKLLLHADALLLLGCWIAYQLLPLTPSLSRSGVVLRFRLHDPLGSGTIAYLLLALLETLTLARIVEALAGRSFASSRKARWSFLGLVLLVPCRMLIAGEG